MSDGNEDDPFELYIKMHFLSNSESDDEYPFNFLDDSFIDQIDRRVVFELSQEKPAESPSKIAQLHTTNQDLPSTNIKSPPVLDLPAKNIEPESMNLVHQPIEEPNYIEPSDESSTGIRSSNSLTILCPIKNIEGLNNYLNRMVSDNHFKKLAKEYKIVIFDKVTNYVQDKYPELFNKNFERLSRKDKRSVTLLDRRLFSIVDIIYNLFQSEERMNLIIPIKRDICKIIAKNKKKNVQFSKEELTFIDKWETSHNT